METKGTYGNVDGGAGAGESRSGEDPGRSAEAHAAVELWRDGLRPVPLRPIGDGGSDGKAPIGEGWAARAYSSEDEIRSVFFAHPGAGVGLVLGLGPDGRRGPVDLAVDEPAAAAATLRAIFGDAGPPRTAGWASARGEHRIYMMSPEDARRLLAAGIDRAALDGRHHPRLAGLEVRLGTLDPDRPKQTQSAAPPTSTRSKDGSVSGPRRYLDRDAGFVPLPEALLDYLIEHLGRRVVAVAAAVLPDRAGLDGLTPVDKFKAQLGKMGLAWSPSGEGFASRCPAHRGTRPNLSFGEGDDGRLLACCHRGCPFGDILGAVNLRPGEAFYYPGPRAQAAFRRKAGPPPRREIDDEARAKLDFIHRRSLDAIEADPARLVTLAELIGAPAAALRRLDVGWREDVEPAGDGWIGTGRWAWVFPEVDGREELVGLLRRYADPVLGKRLVAGGRRGLTVPHGWRDLRGPVYLVEGASDVAALLAVGIPAVGRPNNRGGADDLAGLLGDGPRDVVVLGERDGRPDGTWPGDPRPFARALARRLGRPVEHRLPPAPFKDVREFVNDKLAVRGEGVR